MVYVQISFPNGLIIKFIVSRVIASAVIIRNFGIILSYLSQTIKATYWRFLSLRVHLPSARYHTAQSSLFHHNKTPKTQQIRANEITLPLQIVRTTNLRSSLSSSRGSCSKTLIIERKAYRRPTRMISHWRV